MHYTQRILIQVSGLNKLCSSKDSKTMSIVPMHSINRQDFFESVQDSLSDHINTRTHQSWNRLPKESQQPSRSATIWCLVISFCCNVSGKSWKTARWRHPTYRSKDCNGCDTLKYCKPKPGSNYLRTYIQPLIKAGKQLDSKDMKCYVTIEIQARSATKKAKTIIPTLIQIWENNEESATIRNDPANVGYKASL